MRNGFWYSYYKDKEKNSHKDLAIELTKALEIKQYNINKKKFKNVGLLESVHLTVSA